MDFVVLDLEWSAAFSKRRKKFVNEIIEFGAVRLNEKLERTDEFSMLVTPQIGKKLNPHVQALTRLSMEELSSANTTFSHALSKFAKFAADSVIMTWSTSDIITLLDNVKYFAPDFSMDFMQYYCDVQPFCEQMLDKHEKAKQMALSTCCELTGVEYDASVNHRALEDARATAECFNSLYNERITEFITKADEEFYKRLTFRTHYVTNEQMHRCQVKRLHFLCPHCGTELNPRAKWKVRNHAFRAPFYCANCGKKLLGIVTYKMKYDGVTVNHRLASQKENEEKNEK